MNIHNQLEQNISDQLEAVKSLEVGSDKWKVAIEGISKQMNIVNERDKMNIEGDFKADEQEFERNMKEKQMKQDQIDRYTKHVLTALGLAVPTALTIWGTVKSFEFETNGTISTIMGRGFINKLLPKK